MMLKPSDEICGQQGPRQPDDKPREAVNEAALDRLFARRARYSRALDKAAQPRQIFLMLGEEHSEQAVGRYKTDKPAFGIDD